MRTRCSADLGAEQTNHIVEIQHGFGLDHQFGLNRGFDVYSDHLPRGSDGRLSNERPASDVVNDAIAFYFAEPADARAFVNRFGCGYRAEAFLNVRTG